MSLALCRCALSVVYVFLVAFPASSSIDLMYKAAVMISKLAIANDGCDRL